MGRPDQRAERRQDEKIDAAVQSLRFAPQLPRDKQRQCVQRVRDRSHRRLVEGTGVAGGATGTLTGVLLDTVPSAR